ncbi:MAG TPA: methionine--tRNA ligase [Candidatus Hydrogenedentes bacterium]|nr:methionine--tRNA ligase [Candidatus Hydrogenedentota bacterium]HNT89119.1 methionine--tRNA ligase [Candidatus Hydrogenedentota bacterium]
MTDSAPFERTLVTSALPYANGHIHLGHIAGAYLPADIYVRYKRLKGEKVLYVGGSDEYGVPITLTALKEGVSPREVIDRYHAANADAFRRLGISYDIYGRTSWDLHVDTTQAFFRKLHDGGYVHAEEMELWYSEQSDRYLPDRYVKGTCPKCGYTDANGDECESCGAQYAPQALVEPRANIPGDDSRPILRKSRHWFLDLPRFADRLRAYLDGHPEWRDNARGIAYSWVNDLRARCITRDTDWGVPIPLDDPEAAAKRIYVWFDAPIGYVTNTRQWGIDVCGDASAWELWWKDPTTRMVHFIGKDNVPFHAVIFPAMLMGQEDYILADQVPANEYLNVFNRATGQAEKGSKSRGNMISVRWALEQFPADVIRYYLCAIAPESKDSAFDWDDFMHRYNGELCDVVGNFVHRSLTMTMKNFDGRVPEAPVFDAEDQAMLDAIPAQVDAVAEALEGFRFRQALERFIDLGRKANVYFDAKQPWVTRKTDLERTGTTLHVCCQVVKALCHAMIPFLPDGASTLSRILGVDLPQGGPDGGPDGWNAAKAPLPAGSPLGTPEVLFPKLDRDRIAELAEAHLRGEAF